MQIKERDILVELHSILFKVPFPHDGMGMKTASLTGFVGFSEDMRALLPAVNKLLMGLVIQDNMRRNPELKDEYEEGWDYHNPAMTLEAIKIWVEKRKEAEWDKGSRYMISEIYKTLNPKD